MATSRWNAILPISALLTNVTVGDKIAYGQLVEKTIMIVRSCMVFDRDDALLFAGEYEEFLGHPLLDVIPIALISHLQSEMTLAFALSKHSFEVYKRYSFVMWKLSQFLVVASSQPLLRALLQNTRDSPWANSNAFHILIDRRTEERGCANAYIYLSTAWQYDRLSTIFLCIDPNEGLLVYTFNPYSNTAPGAWIEAGHFKGPTGHPWILFKRRFGDGELLSIDSIHANAPKFCEDLMFDKTTRINGHEVKLNAISVTPHLDIDPTRNGLDRFVGDNGEIIKLVLGKMNATLNVYVQNGTAYDLGGISKDGYMMGMMADVANGEVDMALNSRSLYAMWKVEQTYPHGEDGLCVFTQRATEVSEIVKILSFTSPGVHLGTILVVLIAFGVLAKHQGHATAWMNILRLITMVSMPSVPSNASSRIILCSVYVLLLVETTVIQSHWSSLLTVPVYGRDVRTADDLKRSKFEIYGSAFQGQELQDPELRSRFHATSQEDCKRHVSESKGSACLGDCLHLYGTIRDRRFRISRRIQRNVQVFATRENWPLFYRVSHLILKTVETGIVDMWKRLGVGKRRLRWKWRREHETRSFRNLELGHVMFAFHILLAGHCCATVAFVIEHIIVSRATTTRASVE